MTVSEAACHPFLASTAGVAFFLPKGASYQGYQRVFVDKHDFAGCPKVAKEIEGMSLDPISLLKVGTSLILAPQTRQIAQVSPMQQAKGSSKSVLQNKVNQLHRQVEQLRKHAESQHKESYHQAAMHSARMSITPGSHNSHPIDLTQTSPSAETLGRHTAVKHNTTPGNIRSSMQQLPQSNASSSIRDQLFKNFESSMSRYIDNSGKGHKASSLTTSPISPPENDSFVVFRESSSVNPSAQNIMKQHSVDSDVDAQYRGEISRSDALSKPNSKKSRTKSSSKSPSSVNKSSQKKPWKHAILDQQLPEDQIIHSGKRAKPDSEETSRSKISSSGAKSSATQSYSKTPTTYHSAITTENHSGEIGTNQNGAISQRPDSFSPSLHGARDIALEKAGLKCSTSDINANSLILNRQGSYTVADMSFDSVTEESEDSNDSSYVPPKKRKRYRVTSSSSQDEASPMKSGSGSSVIQSGQPGLEVDRKPSEIEMKRNELKKLLLNQQALIEKNMDKMSQKKNKENQLLQEKMTPCSVVVERSDSQKPADRSGKASMYEFHAEGSVKSKPKVAKKMPVLTGNKSSCRQSPSKETARHSNKSAVTPSKRKVLDNNGAKLDEKVEGKTAAIKITTPTRSTAPVGPAKRISPRKHASTARLAVEDITGFSDRLRVSSAYS